MAGTAVVPAVNLAKILKDVPRGAWVALQADAQKVVTYGFDLRTVMAESRLKGENDPVIVKVPATPSSLVL